MFKINLNTKTQKHEVSTKNFSLRLCAFVSLCLKLIFISSCSNDHCEEPMNSPLEISFYSEIDTTQQVAPAYMGIIGMNDKNAGFYLNASGQNSIQLPLKKFDGSTQFLFAVASVYSPVDVLVYQEERANADCPCSNPNGTVPVYLENDSPVYLCNDDNGMLILYKNEGLNVAFAADRKTDTIFAFRTTEDKLNIKYENTLEFISAECGCLTTFYLNDLEFERNNIGEVFIRNHSVTNKYNEQHIKIYLENY